MSAHETTSPGDIEAPALGRGREALGIVLGALTVLATLALGSYDARGGSDLVGPLGAAFADVLAAAFGLGAWILPVEGALATFRLLARRRTVLGAATVASTLVFVLVGCALLQLAFPELAVFGGHRPGGVLGEVLGEVLRSLLGLVGAFVVGVSILLVTLVLRTPVSVVELVRNTVWRIRDGVTTWAEAWREARALEEAEREAARLATAPRIVGAEDDVPARPRRPSSAGAIRALEIVDAGDDEEGSEASETPAPTAPRARGKKTGGPTIVAPTESTKAKNAAAAAKKPTPKKGDFQLPPTTLLEEASGRAITVDTASLRENAERLTEKLAAYGVQGRVDEIHPGPVVTMYEFEPQSGTKLARIAGLADDLAMALAAQKVRIVAPIPGKARVGFELPNDERQSVVLREILEDPRWEAHSEKCSLPMALGKDIGGQPVYVDLAKMPHLLVAGATGAGKSVGLNVMLVSLLAQKTPEEVRMLMIDPKVVELAVFDGIPHMLLPVVTDMKKAALALKWAVDEMERRYQLFADAGARNVATYNKRVEKVLAGELEASKLFPSRAGKVRAQGVDGEEVLLDPDDGESSDALDKPPEKLPYIVVVVDEFADLMMVAAKDVEACVARLAQKARAAGIHVILATQRPSVDVITGMIKANFPARVAFKVSQREDSKTILGRMGAEHLLGMGDMLMIPPGTSDLKRVHCAFISEDDVKSVCDFLREQAAPVYDDNILRPRDDEDGEDGLPGGTPSDDPVYDRAVAIVTQAGYCSISHIQRQLSVGYNKAAKLVERMEVDGIVGPPSGKAGGRREVLVQAL